LTHDEVMVIEDSRVGLAAAFAADMKVILVPDVEAPDELMLSQCEACVSSLKEAIPVIEGQLSRDRLWSVNKDA
jgi:beta-phosphoglucomutase-like phosphatase (HAD superfamily)